MKYLRLRTSTNSGAVHKSSDGETPDCEVKGGWREWQEVDPETYPPSHWTLCRYDECFGDSDVSAEEVQA